jgi:hypothetical protein
MAQPGPTTPILDPIAGSTVLNPTWGQLDPALSNIVVTSGVGATGVADRFGGLILE